MVPHITTILQRFTGEWAMLLQPDAILTVCREIGYTAWRDRLQPSAASVGYTVDGGGLLSRPCETPVTPL
jgi:hypothetical protein